MLFEWRGIIKEYREFLPEIEEEYIVTLGEGATRLWPAERLKKYCGLEAEVFLKIEGDNAATGSFKDRGMTMAVSAAIAKGTEIIICASTGNTAASAAAYAAKAGILCIVILPEGQVAKGKLLQSVMFGAKIIEVNGNFDQALSIVREVSQKNPSITLVNSLNPDRIEGQKTMAFEICDQLGEINKDWLGRAPDYHFIPVGNGGNITACWKGYAEWFKKDEDGNRIIENLPKMMGFQAFGAAPLVFGFTIEKPQTIASAIRIGNPALGKEALETARYSGGKIGAVTDEEILRAYQFLAKQEAIFCEPASAASVAGLIKTAKDNPKKFKAGDIIVCVLTGNGMKDPDTAQKTEADITKIEADYGAVLKAIGF